jgi:hypothetical protein
VSHADIRNGAARCRNTSCGIEATTRRVEAASRRAGKQDAFRNATTIESEAQRAREREAAARMEAETAHYQMGRPLSQYRSTETGPMTERDRLAIRQRREEEAAQAAAEEEARVAPLIELHRKIAAEQRKRFLSDEIIDIEPFVSEGFEGFDLGWEGSGAFNADSLKQFMKNHPEFAYTSNNLNLLGNYFDRNGLKVTTLEMIENLYRSMVEAGIQFEQRVPEPTPQPEPSTPRKVSLRIGPPSGPPVWEGWDLVTGEPKNFTEREVRNMSSEIFKRTFRLTPDKLALPNVGPGPKRQSEK